MGKWQSCRLGHGRTNMLPARLAVLCIQGLEAAAAERAAVLHDVPLPTQDRLALQAAEVFHVPVSPLGFCAFICKDDLQTERPKGQWIRNSHENTL